MTPKKLKDKSLIDGKTEQTVVLAKNSKLFTYLFDLVKNKKGFSVDVEKIRREWGVDIYEKRLIDGDDKLLIELLKKYNLNPKWKYPISIYIQTGRFPDIADPRGTEISISEDKTHGLIKIYPNTRKDSVIKAWQNIISKLPEKNKSRSRVPKNHDSDIYITELRSIGESYKSIKKINEENGFESKDEFQLNKKNNRIKSRIKKAK